MKCILGLLLVLSVMVGSSFAGQVTSSMISYKKSLVGSFLVFQVLDQSDNLIADSTFTDEDFSKVKHATVFCLPGKGDVVREYVKSTGAQLRFTQTSDSFIVKITNFSQVQRIFEHSGVIMLKPTKIIVD